MNQTVVHQVQPVSMDEAYEEYAAEKRARIEADERRRLAVQAARDARVQAEKRSGLQPVIDAIIRRGSTAHFDGDSSAIVVDGHKMGSWVVYLDEERTNIGMWRTRPTGKTRLVVDVGYGQAKKSFPQRKGGGHNYDEAARMLIADAYRRRREEERRRVAEDNRDAVVRARVDLGLPTDDWSGIISASSTTPGEVHFHFDVKATLTPERAVELGNLLRSFGIKLRHDDFTLGGSAFPSASS